jgi:hypothetical protein
MRLAIPAPDSIKSVVMLAGIALVGFVAWKAYGKAKSLANMPSAIVDSIAHASQSMMDAVSGTGSGTTPSSLSVKAAKALMPSGDGTVRGDALADLNARRAAKNAEALPFYMSPVTAVVRGGLSFYDYVASDSTKAQDEFYKRNPEGVFYD